jgi:hypothetical protein
MMCVNSVGKKDGEHGEGLEDQLKSMKEDLRALKSRRDDLHRSRKIIIFSYIALFTYTAFYSFI